MIWKVTFFYCLGVWASHWIPIQERVYPKILFLVWAIWTLLFGVLLLNKEFSKSFERKYKSLSIILHKSIIALEIFISAILLSLQKDTRIEPSYFGNNEKMELVISIDENPVFSGPNAHFRARVLERQYSSGNTIRQSGYLEVTSPIPLKPFHYGEKLRIKGFIRKITGNSHPAFFNYAQFKANQNIFYQTYIPKGEILFENANTGNPFLAWIYTIQNWANRKMDNQIQDSTSRGFIKTLLIGFHNGVDPNTIQSFIKTGTVHILSISGIHIALLFDLISRILYPFKKIPRWGKPLCRILQISFLWIYAFITGASPPVLRSAWMTSLSNLSEIWRRRMTSLQILGSSALVQLIIEPQNLFDLSFELSYGALLSIMIFQKPIENCFHFQNPLFKSLNGVISVSISAQLGTLPLILWYFHQFPVYFILANLIIIPISSIILYEGVIYLLLIFIGASIPIIGIILKGSIEILFLIAHYFSCLPFSTLSGLYIDVWGFWLLFGIIISVYFYLKAFENKHLWILLLGLSGFLIWILIHIPGMHTQKSLFITLKKNYGIVLFCSGKNGYTYSFYRSDYKKKLMEEENRIFPSLIRYHKLESIINYPLAFMKIREKTGIEYVEIKFQRRLEDSLTFQIPINPYSETVHFQQLKNNGLSTSGELKVDSYFYLRFD